MNQLLFDLLTLLATKLWGHLLIPTLLGLFFWAVCGVVLGWTLFQLIVWIGIFLGIGWFLILASWITYYWDVWRS